MDFHVSLDMSGNLAGQIYQQIRAAIADGRIRPGDALPSTRELAKRLQVSRNTVGLAYEKLIADGLVSSRAGIGTFAASGAPSDDRVPESERESNSPLRPAPVWDDVDFLPSPYGTEQEFDFRPGVPDPQLFPFRTWRALMSRYLNLSTVTADAHTDPAGHAGLRGAIARHLGVSRAVTTTADDVFITEGSHGPIELATRVLMRPGDVVAVEDPGHREMYGIFTALGGTVAGVPVDADGLVVEAIPERARMVYVRPSHQFPLGGSMSLARRLALLEWAERADGVIIEDDRDSELRYAGRPIDPLQSLDRHRRVLYVGSLSRVMLANLRLGFLIAPTSLHEALRKAKRITASHAATPVHAAAAEFIAEGLLARHIRRVRSAYAERHHRLAAILHQDAADHLTPIQSNAGLHIAAVFNDGLANGPDADVGVVKRALRLGVAATALSVFSVESVPRPGLVLGYGAIDLDRIEEGMRRLLSCLD